MIWFLAVAQSSKDSKKINTPYFSQVMHAVQCSVLTSGEISFLTNSPGADLNEVLLSINLMEDMLGLFGVPVAACVSVT